MILGALGEIFSILFKCILSKTSMISAMMGSLYYGVFLHQVGLKEKYSEDIPSPVILRLIHSCYENPEENKNIDIYENYIFENFPKIYRLIISKKNQIDRSEDNLNFIIELGEKIDLNNVQLLDALFYVLEKYRKGIHEYYLLLITCFYQKINSINLGNVNKINKLSNSKTFIEPLHKLLTSFYSFVNNPEVKYEILKDDIYYNPQIILNAFNTAHSNLLNSCLNTLLEHLTKYGICNNTTKNSQ